MKNKYIKIIERHSKWLESEAKRYLGKYKKTNQIWYAIKHQQFAVELYDFTKCVKK